MYADKDEFSSYIVSKSSNLRVRNGILEGHSVTTSSSFFSFFVRIIILSYLVCINKKVNIK